MLNIVVRNINNNNNDCNNNNEEDDQKSENTKAQSEIVNDINSSMNQGTISEIINMDKRYRHVYKGIIYYKDKPDESKYNNNNKNNKNKKNKNSDDELEYENDSDEEDYNK